MGGRIAARLAELGLVLPEPAPPLAAYVPFVVAGPLVVIAGQLPVRDGRIAITGKVGAGLSVEQGQEACRLAFLNVLAQLRAACGGDLDRVARAVRLGGFIACPPDFTDQPRVMNGASELCLAVFGEAGRHARTTVGVAALPGDAAAEVEAMFLLAP